MNKKIRFFQSIHFKIALVFILLLLVTVEIIGAYFVKSLEQQNIDTFKTSVTVDPYIQEKLASDLVRTDTTTANSDIKGTISQADITNLPRFKWSTQREQFGPTATSTIKVGSVRSRPRRT